MSILFFVVVFGLTLFLQNWLHRHIQRLALAITGNPGCAVRLLFYLLLPGVLVHEFSHYVTARLLLVKASGPRLGLGRVKKNRMSLGSVSIAKCDPVRESLIGVAPFAVGIGAIWLLAGVGIGLWPNSPFSLDLILGRIGQSLHDWTLWLDVYLIFAVSTAMIPSESDREPWGPVVTVLGLGAAVLFLMGWAPQVPQDAVRAARQLIDALTFALGIAVVVNGLVGAALWLLERVVGGLQARRMG
ncbi:MAG: hypothetical protein M1132_07485 [Chloroflexi bacterium]|nr:hypothetical protein [Chloroflexota bacterium]